MFKNHKVSPTDIVYILFFVAIIFSMVTSYPAQSSTNFSITGGVGGSYLDPDKRYQDFNPKEDIVYPAGKLGLGIVSEKGGIYLDGSYLGEYDRDRVKIGYDHLGVGLIRYLNYNHKLKPFFKIGVGRLFADNNQVVQENKWGVNTGFGIGFKTGSSTLVGLEVMRYDADAYAGFMTASYIFGQKPEPRIVPTQVEPPIETPVETSIETPVVKPKYNKLSTFVYFYNDEVDLHKISKEAIKKIMKFYDDESYGGKIIITGRASYRCNYCGDDPRSYNMELSELRAISVADYIRTIIPEKLQDFVVIDTKGVGDTEANVDASDTEAAYDRNVSISFVTTRNPKQ